MSSSPRKRPWASAALMQTLREGKTALRQQREALDLREKVRIVLELQRLCLPVLKRHRPLAEWEKPWAITP